jgi:hypothetical protein
MAESVSVARTTRGVLQHFITHQATAPMRAMGFNPTQDSERVLFDGLRADGVIREASQGLFYVDEERLAAQRGEALTRVLAVGAVGAAIGGLLMLRSRRRRRRDRA